MEGRWGGKAEIEGNFRLPLKIAKILLGISELLRVIVQIRGVKKAID